MKKLIFAFFVLSLGLTVACNQSKPAEEAEEATEQTDTAEAAEEAPAEEARPSPARQATGTVGAATVTIDYSSPSVRGRTIWGELVPYGQVWRTGANEATTVTFSQNVTVEGKPLAAGRYALFTIPNADKWTVIFNTVPDQWGSNNYDQSKDALRVDVKPMTTSESTEAMTFTVENGQIVLRWEKLAVPVKVAAG